MLGGQRHQSEKVALTEESVSEKPKGTEGNWGGGGHKNGSAVGGVSQGAIRQDRTRGGK